jgi:hypothetical protein
MFIWWFGGGANKELPPFVPLTEAARTAAWTINKMAKGAGG